MKRKNTSKDSGNSQNYQIDVTMLLRSALRHWYWFVISPLILMSGAFVYNKYAERVYSCTSTILLKGQEYTSQMQMELTEGFGLSQAMTNINNQLYIYSSPKIVSNALAGLDFTVSYRNVGTLDGHSIYGRQVPIDVEMDTTQAQLTFATFRLETESAQGGSIRVQSEAAWRYDFAARAYADHMPITDLDTTVQFRFGVPVRCPMFAFTVYPKPGRTTAELRERTIDFWFNTPEQLVAQWRGRLSLSLADKEGTVAYISAVGHNQEQLVKFLSAVNRAIEQYNIDQKNLKASRTLQFIELQMNQINDSLIEAQNRLNEFRKRNNLAGRTLYADNVQKRYFENEDEIKKLTLLRNYYEHIRSNTGNNADLENYFALSDPDIVSPIISQQIQQLITVQQQLRSVADQTEQNPYRQQLYQDEHLLRSNLETILSQAISRINLRIEECRQIAAELNSLISKLPDVESEYSDLERDFKILDATYTFLLQKQSENQIAKASNTSDCEVLEEPHGVSVVAPQSERIYSTALALSLALPAAILFLLEYFNSKIRTADELMKTVPDVPLLAVVPQSSSTEELICIKEPQRVTSEAFRGLRVKLQFMNSTTDAACKTIMFSSCNSGEGKTYCAANTASVFALTGKRTLIMNFDLRCPRMEASIGISPTCGIADYLADLADVESIIVPSGVNPNLFVAPAGSIPPNPAELIASVRTKELMDYAHKNFDIIIVDTAPVGQVSDCRMLETFCDSFVFVTYCGRTEYSHIQHIIESLKQENVKSLGLLFNGQPASERSYGNYGYYNRDSKYLKS